MVDMYVALVIAGRRSIDGPTPSPVPVKFKIAVLADLNAIGLDGNGNPIEEVIE